MECDVSSLPLDAQPGVRARQGQLRIAARFALVVPGRSRALVHVLALAP